MFVLRHKLQQELFTTQSGLQFSVEIKTSSNCKLIRRKYIEIVIKIQSPLCIRKYCVNQNRQTQNDQRRHASTKKEEGKLSQQIHWDWSIENMNQSYSFVNM